MFGGQSPEIFPRSGDSEVGDRVHVLDSPRLANGARRSVTIVKRGDRAAQFELPDQTGTSRRLTELLADGPVVL
jgi:hypothetical protein